MRYFAAIMAGAPFPVDVSRRNQPKTASREEKQKCNKREAKSRGLRAAWAYRQSWEAEKIQLFKVQITWGQNHLGPKMYKKLYIQRP